MSGPPNKNRRWILVGEPADLKRFEGMPSIPVEDYLAGDGEEASADATVVNLCRSYEYLSRGYYVSLVADARRQPVLPSVADIEELAVPYAYFRTLREAGLDVIDLKVIPGRRVVLPKTIVAKPADDDDGVPAVRERGESAGDQARYVPSERAYVDITAVMGRTTDERFRRHAADVFKLFHFPCLRLRLYEVEGRWRLGQVFASMQQRLEPGELALLKEVLAEGRFVRAAGEEPPARISIACLHDLSDDFAPSNERALDRFERAARRRGAFFELIDRSDLSRLAEYDALFIRTHTSIDNYTFGFAQTAESLGIPVIDDPTSIVRCSNKVYLFELFRRAGIPTPRTKTISRTTELKEVEDLGYPMVVKLPDGSFSTAVKKVADLAELETVTSTMFKRSPLLIVQEFRPTAFDWRIGVLEGQPLFACRYHMARDHWQIAEYTARGDTREGEVDAVPLAEAPFHIVDVAVRAARLIGDGLYGVDVKPTDEGPMVIEVNDNPNIDAGYEDGAEKDAIYDRVIDTLLKRIEAASKPLV